MLKYDEGFSLKVYPCSEGKRTVSIGVNLDADEHFDILHRHLKFGDYITETEATALFEKCLNKAKADIKFYIPDCKYWPERYQLVVLNMTYQLGIRGVTKFQDMIRAMNREDDKAVVAAMKDSKWYRQTPNRAECLMKVVMGLPVKEYI
jgi:GH24 family phage-related lysozyme (muramidase)